MPLCSYCCHLGHDRILNPACPLSAMPNNHHLQPLPVFLLFFPWSICQRNGSLHGFLLQSQPSQHHAMAHKALHNGFANKALPLDTPSLLGWLQPHWPGFCPFYEPGVFPTGPSTGNTSLPPLTLPASNEVCHAQRSPPSVSLDSQPSRISPPVLYHKFCLCSLWP